ncbi:acyltransferase-domain-containing protein [Lipomyces japonicus]|uniref:acyltransferase-domain-containing protein n=1 Tax=Lipomyces japonicus TaxID=56871 RepID=UPI0034CE4138
MALHIQYNNYANISLTSTREPGTKTIFLSRRTPKNKGTVVVLWKIMSSSSSSDIELTSLATSTLIGTGTGADHHGAAHGGITATLSSTTTTTAAVSAGTGVNTITKQRDAVTAIAALRQKPSALVQAVRIVSFLTYFLSTVINFSQLVGLPLALFSRNWFHAYRDYTKQSFGILLTSVTQWWSPTPVHVTGDRSVAGLISKSSISSRGLLQTKFGERAVLMANHQIYSDWLYLWWVAYTAKIHGGIYIMLKDSLKNIPFIGWGMQYYKFIFLSRKWKKDEATLGAALEDIDKESDWPAWLLIFPEGTNFTQNGIDKSHAYAERTGLVEPRHLLLPRARGLYYTLKTLNVPYVYDCTFAYEGVPRGGFGQDFFTLPGIFFQGRPPKSVHMHWRRFDRSLIPLQDEVLFEKWLHKRWLEKDELLERYYVTGRFDHDGDDGIVIDTEVRLGSRLEVFRFLVPPGLAVLGFHLAWKAWHFFDCL